MFLPADGHEGFLAVFASVARPMLEPKSFMLLEILGLELEQMSVPDPRLHM